ncbi:MAG: metallophosphoesterase family protein [Pseudomonadota bacterium]
MTVIGVISDTHGLLRPEAINALTGAELIIHAGDIGPESILDRLADIAPVTAVRGNVDRAPWCHRLKQDEVIEAGGRLIYVIHDIGDLNMSPQAAGFDAVVFGHSHKPVIDEKQGVLYLNPGSAGPRRFSLPVSLATLQVDGSEIRAELHSLTI